jgi:hypothetical protein
MAHWASQALLIDGAGAAAKVQVLASLRREKVQPRAKLDTLHIPLRPAEAELAPLGTPRDTLWEGRVIHRLLLTYKLSLTEGGQVTPTLPMLNRCGWLGVTCMWFVHEGWGTCGQAGRQAGRQAGHCCLAAVKVQAAGWAMEGKGYVRPAGLLLPHVCRVWCMCCTADCHAAVTLLGGVCVLF